MSRLIESRTVQAGGLWVNLGPLQYHWADAHTYLPGEEVSIELCLEDVERLAADCGLKMVSKEMVPARFNQDPRQAAKLFNLLKPMLQGHVCFNDMLEPRLHGRHAVEVRVLDCPTLLMEPSG